jgi:hypothetical protein
MKPTVKQDMQHLRNGYALLHEALDEFLQVYRKDNILAHTVRVLGAIEDTIYQMITSRRAI